MNTTNKIFLGLRWKRLLEWAADVWAEKPGLGEIWMMTRMSFRAAFTPVSREQYFHRLSVCERCPIFNHTRKSCRNGDQGCGCYVPYKALAPVDCWLREQNPSAGWGVSDLTQFRT